MMSVAAQPSRGAQRYQPFVEDIVKVCDAPGTRAALRRGLGRPPEQAYTMHAVVAWRLPENPPRALELAYYTVAAMIATLDRASRHATGSAVGHLGDSFARAVCRPAPGHRPLPRDTAERRLHLLVRQSLPGVHRHLPGQVRHLRALDVPINWAQLIDDLSRWTAARDRVTKRWLQDFYRSLHTHTLKE